MKDNLSLKNLFRRFTSETPEFLKSLRNVGLVMLLLSSIIAGLKQSGFTINDYIQTIGLILASVGTSIVTTSSLASKDNYQENR